MIRIAIVGAGASGAVAALLLARRAHAPLELLLVDPRPRPGPGLAHSTPHPDHRLNGPASIHSPYPDDPGAFARWMDGSGALARDPDAVDAGGLVFARRGDFGAWIADEVDRHACTNPSGSRIEHVRRTATRVRTDADGCTVELDGGGTLRADRCVLAPGWSPPAVPAPLRPIAHGAGWIGDPWDLRVLDAVPRDADVLLVGAGLTASDVFAVLAAQRHAGRVVALSRHGLRPASQNPFRSDEPLWNRLLDPEPAFVRRHGRPATAAAALRALRADIAALDPDGASWHGRLDELRDSSHLFWPDWPARERRRFARHLKTPYDAHRYRNPPQIERILARGVADGRLAYASGRIVSAARAGGRLVVEWTARDGGRRHVERTDVVVNCTGPRPRPSDSDNPLWRTLLADGRGRDDASGLGIEVDAALRVRAADGRVDDRLFAIGPPTSGSLGETTSVPHVARAVLRLVEPLQAPAG